MIKVIKPGLMTTVQDNGRWGYQAFGMPVAGAMDNIALKVANMLLGNDENQAVLEFTMMGGEYEFEQDCFVAITGADMSATLDGKTVANWSAFAVSAGSVLNFTFAVSGCRAYLAISGGLDVPVVLGSRSTHTRSKVGGLEGRALKSGDILKTLPCDLTKCRAQILPTDLIPEIPSVIKLRIILGPQEEDFTPLGIETLFTAEYKITNEADRMGYRMEGSMVEHATKPDIVSDALCQGAVQIPGHGMPIIMMADRQTTGGYTKIGTVISSDLRLLAQAKPGDTVTFVEVDDEVGVEALQVTKNYYEKVRAFINNSCEKITGANAKNFTITVNNNVYAVQISEK